MISIFICIHIFVLLALPLVKGELPLLPKCCPLDTMRGRNYTCIPSNHTMLTPFKPWLNYPVVHKHLECRLQHILRPGEFRIDGNGNLIETETGHVEREFCIDLIFNRGRYSVTPFLCLVLKDTSEESRYLLLTSVGLLISTPFLFATTLVYTTTKQLRTIYGHCVIIYTALLTVSYFLVGTQGVYGTLNEEFDISEEFCIVLGFAVQFFFLATFFWLNVMCIDIYWAFSGIKLRGTASERDRKKLLAYSFYAWGMPLIILAVTVGVDYSDSIPSSSIFKPNMGKDRCFFKGRTATWTYFYGPMAVILFSNLILFSITAYRIWRHRRETAQSFHRGDSRRHDGNESERFNLYLKLFLVMGINWISELISFMFGKDVPQYLWYITDITNTLQGVFIFLIFVWKKRVRKLLWEKLCGGKQSQLRSSTMTTSTALNSSTR
ncbi:G-protein coupled receptor Mth2-like isoform X3 [Cimex lectularius]|uniref:G-protein coupled receptors family 2 profile 2 domain-containing protein n=1 Tax=Cimex lectularius TaxID=79782 RepID=A0A8I6S0Q3_CIMLE|nr:G-protein coupled receptor Mth2-like isoform X3 [Cimex lectularius]